MENIARNPTQFEARMLFLDNRKVYILPAFRHKQAQPRTQGPNGSALNLAGGLRDVNIAKDMSVYFS